MRPSLKHQVEYGFLRGFSGFLGVLPYRVALGAGWVLAVLGHYGFRFRVRVARHRIREVFGDRFSDRAVRRIAWRSWRNLCFNVVEILRMGKIDRAWIEKHVDLPDPAPLLERARRGEPIVLATMHMGNWDLAGVGASLLGLPVFFIARRQNNPLTDQELNRMRNVTGVETLLRANDTAKEVLKRLKAGKTLAILPDVRYPTPGLAVQFLGGEANLAPGMGLFARQVNAPIFPVVASRTGWTGHRWRLFAPIHPDPALSKEEDLLRMTRAVINQFDREIRDHPEQYFWFNKRWILDPLRREESTEIPPAS
jgi:KDO2-lipid IV(A) lauroyltransferase